jgi:hypothetical protein
VALKIDMINFFYTAIQNQLTVHYRKIPYIVIVRQFGGGTEGERRRCKRRRKSFPVDMLVRSTGDSIPFQMNQHNEGF